MCVYAGSLVPPEVLGHAPAGARLVDTQHLSLDEIVDGAARRRTSAATTSRACTRATSRSTARSASRPGGSTSSASRWDVTPGVPAFAAAAATLRRELTLPGVAQTVILTRHSRESTAMPAGEELASLAAHGTTLVLHLAVQALDEIAATLVPHYGADCPAVVVARASWPDELVLTGTLATIAAAVREAGVRRTAVVMVGPCARTRRLRREPPLLVRRATARPAPMTAAARADARRHGRGARARGGAHARRRARDLVAGRAASPARGCPRARCAWAASAAPRRSRAGWSSNDIAAVVDATHPFAERISRSAAAACERAEVPLLRLERPGWSAGPGDDWHWVDDTAAAAAAHRRASAAASS